MFEVRNGGRSTVFFMGKAEDVVEADLWELETSQPRGLLGMRRFDRDSSEHTHDYEEHQKDVPNWGHHLGP